MYQIPIRSYDRVLEVPKEEINRMIEELENSGIVYEDSSPYLVTRTAFGAVVDFLREIRPDLKVNGSTIEVEERGWMNFLYTAHFFDFCPDKLAISHFCKK